MDMERDLFAEQPFGAEALKKMGPVPENFRLYRAAWLDNGKYMEVVGAEFRRAKSGKNKGKLCMYMKGTDRRALLTAQEVSDTKNSATDAGAG